MTWPPEPPWERVRREVQTVGSDAKAIALRAADEMERMFTERREAMPNDAAISDAECAQRLIAILRRCTAEGDCWCTGACHPAVQQVIADFIEKHAQRKEPKA